MKFVLFKTSDHSMNDKLVDVNTIEELIELYENAREENHYVYAIEISKNASFDFGPDEAKYEIEILDDEDRW